MLKRLNQTLHVSTAFADHRRTLVIATATDIGSVALFDGRKCIDYAEDMQGRAHAERLIPLIAGLTNGGKADHILVECGPGSFTGIRIGIAAARGLGLGWGIKVTGYSLMKLLATEAFAVEANHPTNGVAQFAGHGALFVQSFARDGVTAITGLASLSPALAATYLNDPAFVGDAAQVIADAHGSGIVLSIRVGAASVARLLPHHCNLIPAPIYGRNADAKPSA